MISVVIPCHERPVAVEYMTALLESVLFQRGVLFDVVVSDNSRNDEIEKLCEKYKAILPLRYFRNKKFGAGSNLNSALDHATYGKVKIMCSDDLFIAPDALKQFSVALESGAWVASGSRVINGKGDIGRYHKPTWNDKMLQGSNSIGMPSVVAVRKSKIRFDPALTTCLDCEYYWRHYKQFGEPQWIQLPLIGQRYWNGSMSNTEPNSRKKDFEYLKDKYWNENLVCYDAPHNTLARNGRDKRGEERKVVQRIGASRNFRVRFA